MDKRINKGFLIVLIFFLSGCSQAQVIPPVDFTQSTTQTPSVMAKQLTASQRETTTPTNTSTSILPPAGNGSIQLAPTLNQIQPQLTPTEFPQELIDKFIDRLITDLNTHQYQDIIGLMSQSFDLQYVPLGPVVSNREEAMLALKVGPIPPNHPQIMRSPSDRFKNGGYPGTAPYFYFIETTGWGVSGQDRGNIELVLEEGQIHWGGLLLYADTYKPSEYLETTQTPSRLIYQKNQAYYRVEPDGNSQLIFSSKSKITFSPNGEWAVSGQLAENKLQVIPLNNGENNTLSLNGFLMWGVDEASWLNTQTLLVGLADSYDNAHSQGASGHLSLVDIISGSQVDLPISVDGYSQPSTTSDGRILYNSSNGAIMEWQNGQLSPFPLGEIKAEGNLLTSVNRPYLSPDGKMMIGLTSEKEGAETLPAYVLVNLTDQVGKILLTYNGIPTDARIPIKIFWSPESQWIAIDSIDYDPIQNGIYLFSIDGLQHAFLGSGSSDPIWLNSRTIVFSFSSNGSTCLKIYDLVTQEFYWLNLPAVNWNQGYGRVPASISAVLIPKE